MMAAENEKELQQLKKRILEQEREDIQRSQTQLSNQLDDINKQINSIKKNQKKFEDEKIKTFFQNDKHPWL